ncbi:LAQU0S35e00232g1_1 [Lachancea quebecensis]|uniref:LAQU0S35e00232g1_1 n=1 Tax=Lachancea quebecensis TaxID=1654605 RepID=A0A0P1KYL2_9SACH|nr:LAQU0S35e00232g1_1 [Lachancea quebecensis]
MSKQISNFRRKGLVFLTSVLCIGTLIAGFVLAIVAERNAVKMKNTRKTFSTVATEEWANPQFPRLHKTCNTTDVEFLTKTMNDTQTVASYAKEQLLVKGSNDTVYKRWFGDGPLYDVLGVIEGVANMTKMDVLLRCDDVDGLCAANPNYYAGHHRENADAETVICDYFYETRAWISDICSNGTLKEFPPTRYAGIDMIHRYFHVSFINEDEYIGEFTEEAEDVLELAKANSTFAVRNVDNYLYYLADVYSSVHVPGGCLGMEEA